MTMFELPNELPRLGHGKGGPGTWVCAQQAVEWLVSGSMDLDSDITDRPACVQPWLNSLAISVNDEINTKWRHRMWPVLLRQPGTARPELEPGLTNQLRGFIDVWREQHHMEYQHDCTGEEHTCEEFDEDGDCITCLENEDSACVLEIHANYLIDSLTATQDEWERITGGPATCPTDITMERFNALGELVGTVPW